MLRWWDITNFIWSGGRRPGEAVLNPMNRTQPQKKRDFFMFRHESDMSYAFVSGVTSQKNPRQSKIGFNLRMQGEYDVGYSLMRLLGLTNVAQLYDGRNPGHYVCGMKGNPHKPVLYTDYRDGLKELVEYTGLPHPEGRTPKAGRIGMADHFWGRPGLELSATVAIDSSSGRRMYRQQLPTVSFDGNRVWKCMRDMGT